MTGVAVLIMLIAIIIIWGGLAVTVTAIVSRGHREQAEDRARASVDHLVDVVGPTIQHYLTGPLPAHR